MTLNNSHPSINFTMELEENGRLPFLGMDIILKWMPFEHKGVCPKAIRDTGLLLHYHSQRIEEHKGSAIGNHLKEEHDIAPVDIAQFFKILKKCQSKFDCLIFYRILAFLTIFPVFTVFTILIYLC